MVTKKINLLIALCFLSGVAFAAKERTITVQNSVRVGYDDNVYRENDKHGSGYITDIINLNAKLNFSSRTDMLLYWQPEFRYRFDTDPEFVTYQDFYARLNHAISQRTFLQISDRLRYRERDRQNGSGLDRNNQEYLENDLMGSVDYTINSLSWVKVGGGFMFREWDDDDYGKNGHLFNDPGGRGMLYTGDNNFDRYKGSASYIRQLRPNTTQGSIGVMYTDLDYEGDRGGYDSTVVYGGLDHNFNPNLAGNIQLGASFSSVDNYTGSNDSESPYAQASLGFNPTARTSLTGSLGYSVQKSENSYYNAQDQFSTAFGVRHDLTAKISVASGISYIYSSYDSDYSQSAESADVPDAEDNYFKFNIRASYQINRANFIDAGYEYTDRDSDDFSNYDRNRIDMGWRLRL
jgi:hypothetical protein